MNIYCNHFPVVLVARTKYVKAQRPWTGKWEPPASFVDREDSISEC